MPCGSLLLPDAITMLLDFDCLSWEMEAIIIIIIAYLRYLSPESCFKLRAFTFRFVSFLVASESSLLAKEGGKMTSLPLRSSSSISSSSSAVDGVSWIKGHSPGFHLHGDQVCILKEPEDFYTTLMVCWEKILENDDIVSGRKIVWFIQWMYSFLRMK